MADIVYAIEKPQEKCDTGRLTPQSESSDSTVENACVSCIDDTILPPQRKLPENVSRKLNNVGLILAIVTLVCSLTMSGFGFFTSNDSDSSATFGFAFDSFFAVISSSILIWRFSTRNSDSYSIAKRETHATAIVAICLVVSSIAIFVRAVNCLYKKEKPVKPVELLILTSASFLVYSVLFVIKHAVAKKLGSGCLMTDAMDSLCGAIFALSILVSAVILKFTAKVWYLDSAIAIVVAVCSFAYGLIVIEKLLHVFRKREEKARKDVEREHLLKLPERGSNELEQNEKKSSTSWR